MKPPVKIWRSGGRIHAPFNPGAGAEHDIDVNAAARQLCRRPSAAEKVKLFGVSVVM